MFKWWGHITVQADDLLFSLWTVGRATGDFHAIFTEPRFLFSVHPISVCIPWTSNAKSAMPRVLLQTVVVTSNIGLVDGWLMQYRLPFLCSVAIRNPWSHISSQKRWSSCLRSRGYTEGCMLDWVLREHREVYSSSILPSGSSLELLCHSLQPGGLKKKTAKHT